MRTTELEQQRTRVQDELSSAELRIGGYQSELIKYEELLNSETNATEKDSLRKRVLEQKMCLEKSTAQKYMLQARFEELTYALEACAQRNQRLVQEIRAVEDALSHIQLQTMSFEAEIEELKNNIETETNDEILDSYKDKMAKKTKELRYKSEMIQDMQMQIQQLTYALNA